MHLFNKYCSNGTNKNAVCFVSSLMRNIIAIAYLINFALDFIAFS